MSKFFKNVPPWVKWGISGLIIGYVITFFLVVGFFGGNFSGSCLTNIYCIGEPFVMSFFGFFIYIPVAIIGALLEVFLTFLKKKGKLSRFGFYIFLIILGCILVIGISFIINSDLVKSL